MKLNPIRIEARSQGTARIPAASPRTAAPAAPFRAPVGRSLLAKAALAVALAFGAYHLATPGGGTASGSAGGVAKVTLSAADINQGLARQAQRAVRMGLPIPDLPNATQELRRNVREGKVTFYTVYARDSADQDSDVITLQLGSGGTVGPFPLTKAGRAIQVPVVEGQSPTVEVIAVEDGSHRNRVTVGIRTSGGTWFSRTMREGSTQVVPLVGR